MGNALCTGRRGGHRDCRLDERAAVPHHPALSGVRLHRVDPAAAGTRVVAMIDAELIPDLLIQGVQMTSVLVLAPLLTGLVRIVKARMQRRQGPPLWPPYR